MNCVILLNYSMKSNFTDKGNLMSLNGKIALIKRWIGIVSGNNRVAVIQGGGKLYSKDDIAGYYNDLTGKVNEKTLLDDNGIAVNLIEGNKIVHFPISIFQYALGLWDLYLANNDEEKKRQFLNQCEWIIANQRKDGSWNCFEPIGYHQYTVSSMGQGEAISVLARAYKITGEQRWMDSAQRAMKFMLIPVSLGGTLLVNGCDYFFEEYPDESGAKRSVLNGWIFTLFGILDYLKLQNDLEVQDIYNRSIDTLIRHLKDYDAGYWSFYDQTGRIASPAYHDLHIALLKTLSDLTNQMLFKEIADKWQYYSEKKLNRVHAIMKKAAQKFKESPEGIIIQ